MGVVINCMGKGKEDSPTYMYTEIYTQLEGGEKNDDQHRYILCHGEGEGRQSNVHVHRDLHTARRRWEKNNDQHRYILCHGERGRKAVQRTCT